MTDDTEKPLDQLYSMLAQATGLEDGLEQQRQQLREHVTQRETQLQQQRQVAEAAGDTAQRTRIDSELDELRRAWATLTDDDTETGELPQDQHDTADRDRDKRGGSGDQGDTGA